MLDIIYYKSPSGAVGISLDEGESVMIPTGRVLPIAGTVWEEDSEDLEHYLSNVQKNALEELRSRPPMTDIEEMAWRLRKGRMATAKQYVQPKPPQPEVRESARVVSAKIEPD